MAVWESEGATLIRPLTASTRVRVGMIALAAMAAWSCGDPRRDAAEQIRRLTVPPGGRASERGSPGRRSQSLAWSWDVDTPLGWDAYVDQLGSQLSPFHLATRELDRVVFARFRDGDQFLLTCTNVAGFSSTRVHVVLVVLPD